MRRQDLQVGMHVYVSRRQNWESSTFLGEHLVIAAVEPYVRNQRTNECTPASPHASKTGVLVQTPDAGAQDIVQLAHIKGEWETVSREVADREQARKTAASDKAARDKARALHTAAVRDRSAAIGLTRVQGASSGFFVPTDVLETLLDALPEGWTYPSRG